MITCITLDRSTTEGKVVGGITALAGAALVATAIIFASGVFGVGSMYFIAAGCAVASLIPFCLSAVILAREIDGQNVVMELEDSDTDADMNDK